MDTNTINRFEQIFDRTLKTRQIEGMTRLIHRAHMGISEAQLEQTAYILATAFWESALTFEPVREGLAVNDQAAREYVAGLYQAQKIKVNYAEPAANGQSFYGRGYVQLTWEKNYRAIGDHLIGDPDLFYDDPDLVMHPDTAAIIMVRGMLDGIFTGHRLSEFVNRDRVDFVHARQVVNRMDRAEKIAEWAEKFVYVLGGQARV